MARRGRMEEVIKARMCILPHAGPWLFLSGLFAIGRMAGLARPTDGAHGGPDRRDIGD